MHMYIYGAMCAHVLVRARARPSWPPVARARAFELLSDLDEYFYKVRRTHGETITAYLSRIHTAT